MTYLFIDDERNPTDVTWVTGFDAHAPWAVVRSYDDAVQWVKDHGCPTNVSFDHDLGMNGNTTAKTGYDFATWLVDYDIDNNVMPAGFQFTVHSMNPIGAKNIKFLMENYLKLR